MYQKNWSENSEIKKQWNSKDAEMKYKIKTKYKILDKGKQTAV